MKYELRRIKSDDIDSIWSLIEILKAEGAEITFTELTTKEEILNFVDNPDARGSGLAAELTNYGLGQMKKVGVNIARIYVYSNNKASLNAVKKLGFVHGGTVLRHHKDLCTAEYVDDLIFHKVLDA